MNATGTDTVLSRLDDRVRDGADAVTECVVDRIPGAVLSRGECKVAAVAIAVAQTAREVVGHVWPTELLDEEERLRLKLCAGAQR